MESSVIAAIISMIGAGLLGMFGYSIRHIGAKINTLEERLNAKIDKLEERLNTRIDKLEERLNTRIDKLEEKVDNLAVELRSEINTLKVGLVKIATTQAEHSVKLQHMMEHGEGISALEGAVFGAVT